MKMFRMMMVAAAAMGLAVSAQASTVLMDATTNYGSFELPAVGPENNHGSNGTMYFFFASPTGWNYLTDGTEGSCPAIATGGTWSTGRTVAAPDGNQFAVICLGGYLYQDGGALGTFQADTIYTLTGIGARDGSNSVKPQLAMGTNSYAVVSTLADTSMIYEFVAFDTLTINTQLTPEVVGQNIQVVCRLIEGSGPGTYALFDSITLTATAVPEPVTLTMLALGGLFLRRK
jgi:hypothetical protein